MIAVDGRIDPVLADFIRDSIRKAEDTGAEALVIQLDSPGALISRSALDSLVFHVGHATVPVAVWVGPSGAHAIDGAFELVRAAAISGVAQGSRIGGRLDPALGARRVQPVVGAAAARRARLVDLTAPTLGDFIVGLDGRRVGKVTLDTASVVRSGGGPRRRPNVVVSFAKPSLLPRLLHTTTSPSVAYTLLVIGLLLIVFEFFTAGVGVAGICGAVAVALAAYGLAILPTQLWALFLIGLGVFGYAIDVQTGVPRAWTVIGGLSLAAGGWFLYREGSVGVVPWLIVTAGTPLFMVGGMAGMLRSRFGTPTIGRESMIGEEGTAVGAVNPEGTVKVRGALWRARTNRATPIPGGDAVRVAAIDGLLLEVEPLEGAARDAGH